MKYLISYSPASEIIIFMSLNFSYNYSKSLIKPVPAECRLSWTPSAPHLLHFDVGNQWKRKLGLIHSVWKSIKKFSFCSISTSKAKSIWNLDFWGHENWKWDIFEWVFNLYGVACLRVRSRLSENSYYLGHLIFLLCNNNCSTTSFLKA